METYESLMESFASLSATIDRMEKDGTLTDEEFEARKRETLGG